MATAPFKTLVHFLRGLATCAGADGTPDQELLRRFVERRDESAFAAIVRRHGSMVLSVCRRVLHDAGAAEDAFQVTFVILSQKAAALREGGLLANWLYGVARRTALKARTLAARRRRREQQTAVPPIRDPLAELSLRESLTVLDEELSRLPAKFQAPLLLCCLEGHTRDEAAQQLGWPLPLVKSRLEQARDLLRKRLTRRGLTLSAGLFTVLLSQSAVQGAVPAALMATTVQAAAGGVIPPQLAALTQGVLNTMLLTKFKAAMALFVAVTMIGLGGSLLAHRLLADGTGGVSASNASNGPSGEKDADKTKAPPRERPQKPLTEREKAVNALKATYRLAENEDIKCMKPPYPDRLSRQEYLRIDAPETQEAALHFLWNKGQLKPWGGQFGNPAPPLSSWFYNLAGIYPEELEGDEGLLKTPIEADFITREGVAVAKLLPSLESILRKEFKMPVRLSLQKVMRKVYVANGKYDFKPVPGRPNDRIEIYANHLTEDPNIGGGGSGEFDKFIKWVGRFVGQRVVVGDIENAPKGEIRWHNNVRGRATDEERKVDRDPITVFQRLSVQTGLGFREENRMVQVVVVERKE